MLCEQTVSDIRSCSNTCNTYYNKKFIVKCLASPVWDGRLGDFVGLFTTRRGEFLFAMNLHTTVAVDDMGKVMKEANERYDFVYRLNSISLLNSSGRNSFWHYFRNSSHQSNSRCSL